MASHRDQDLLLKYSSFSSPVEGIFAGFLPLLIETTSFIVAFLFSGACILEQVGEDEFQCRQKPCGKASGCCIFLACWIIIWQVGISVILHLGLSDEIPGQLALELSDSVFTPLRYVPNCLEGRSPCLSIEGHPDPDYNGAYSLYRNVTLSHDSLSVRQTKWPVFKNQKGVYWYPIREESATAPLYGPASQWRLGPLELALVDTEKNTRSRDQLDLRLLQSRERTARYEYSSIPVKERLALPIGHQAWTCHTTARGPTGGVHKETSKIFECEMAVMLLTSPKDTERRQRNTSGGYKQKEPTNANEQEEADARASHKAKYADLDLSLQQFLTEKVYITKPSYVSEYTAALEDFGVESVGDLLYLNEDDVHALGMRAVHQRKFKQALMELRVGTKRAL
eukprot:COSAG02_NODE_9504_length_2195_cov_1.544847_2_plen_396_part_00